ncbi:MAG TPA: 4'-phosphopantetheinyl transferase superfamily protein [Bacteroidia bacterium]|nr:4'-phosphopantetheinyl transferase superfamily protein [Bacteroidia bacterium]
MPLVKRIEAGKNSFAGIWEVTETLEDLQGKSGGTEKIPEEFIREERKRQWIAVRALLEALRPGKKIVYDTNGKPFTDDPQTNISISHSGIYVLVYVSDELCGADIERVSGKAERIAKRFLSEREFTEAAQLPAGALITYWAAKEAAYKREGVKEISFRSDIFVGKPDDAEMGIVPVQIYRGGKSINLRVRYETFNDYRIALTEPAA